MLKIVRSPDIYIKDTGEERGRGAFAARNFGPGELVEIAPVLLLSTPRSEMEEELRRRTFNWGNLGGNDKGSEAISFGYGSMYNHANPSNLRYAADNQQLAIVFTAVRAITEHEELTINYNADGGGHTWPDDTWFSRNDIVPL
jgi:SET domain-containing protein